MNVNYDKAIHRIIRQQVEKAIRAVTRLQQVDVGRDFAGVDFLFTINECCPLAVRARYDRPPDAHNVDVTFRSTERLKIRAKTYAPLMFYVWFVKGEFIYGRLIDVYTLAENVDPPLDAFDARPLIYNSDGTAFFTVTIEELRKANAQLRHGDCNGYVTEAMGGEQRLRRILRQYQESQPA